MKQTKSFHLSHDVLQRNLFKNRETKVEVLHLNNITMSLGVVQNEKQMQGGNLRSVKKTLTSFPF